MNRLTSNPIIQPISHTFIHIRCARVAVEIRIAGMRYVARTTNNRNSVFVNNRTSIQPASPQHNTRFKT